MSPACGVGLTTNGRNYDIFHGLVIDAFERRLHTDRKSPQNHWIGAGVLPFLAGMAGIGSSKPFNLALF